MQVVMVRAAVIAGGKDAGAEDEKNVVGQGWSSKASSR